MLLSHHNERCFLRPRRGVAVSDAVRARTDPTGTAPISGAWDAEFARRFARVKRVIREVVVRRDLLGVGDDVAKKVEAIANGGSSQQRVARVLDVIRGAVQSEILVSPGWGDSWQNRFVVRSVTKGVTDAYRRMRAAGLDVTLELALDAPVGVAAQRRADFIAERSYNELAGIDDDMAAEMQSIIQQGLLEGKSPQQIARELDNELDIGRTRARTLARTETIAAHADASLDAYEDAGLDAVTAEVEFTTAGDDRVCPECEALSGTTYTIEDARDVIPVHPNCRCAWLPVVASLQDAIVADWNPFQPRVPAGQAGGGEWTEGGGGAGTGTLSFGAGGSKKGLESAHVNALRQYTASVYYPVNKALRDKSSMTSMEQEVVRALDEAFDRHQKTTEIMQLFRADGDAFASVIDTLKAGDDVEDPGFVSTTVDENYARTLLSGQPGERKVLVEIVTPKGSRAISTEPYNPFKGENEYLLPRNTTFRYLGKERDVYRFRANPKPFAA